MVHWPEVSVREGNVLNSGLLNAWKDQEPGPALPGGSETFDLVKPEPVPEGGFIRASLSDLTSFALVNTYAWNRLSQRFWSLGDFNLKLCKTAGVSSAELPVVIFLNQERQRKPS